MMIDAAPPAPARRQRCCRLMPARERATFTLPDAMMR